MRKTNQKVVDESYQFPDGSLIKNEVWINSKQEMVKYSIAYINPKIFAGDNGRVLGYDNAHNYHHKHYYGNISPVDDFLSYQEIVERFKRELQEFIK